MKFDFIKLWINKMWFIFNKKKVYQCAESNLEQYESTGEYSNSFVTFESESGQDIIHPFMSECLRYTVDPVKHYGDDFLHSITQWRKLI